jgi:cytoskeletal protein CcmA (bactofilin family)
MKFSKNPGDVQFPTEYPNVTAEPRSTIQSGEPHSCLSEGTDINGEVRFTDTLRVDASVSGSIVSDSGNLIIGERGRVKANIEAGTVEVNGRVEGSITAKTKVEIHASGRVHGDIFTPALIIEYGAVFDGKCHMETKKEEPVVKNSRLDRNLGTPESNLKTAEAV